MPSLSYTLEEFAFLGRLLTVELEIRYRVSAGVPATDRGDDGEPPEIQAVEFEVKAVSDEFGNWSGGAISSWRTELTDAVTVWYNDSPDKIDEAIMAEPVEEPDYD